jgi:hypothetical protein
VSNAALMLVRSEPEDSSSPPVEAMFRFLGTDVRVVSASVGVLHRWTDAYGAFRIQPGPAAITVRVHGEEDAAPSPGEVVIESGGLRREWQGTSTVLPPLATPPLDRWTYLRGAAVGRAGHAVLILGGARVGKTLLALSMVARGARLLADGLLPLDPGDLLLAPFPEALRLRREELASLGTDPAHPALVPYRTATGSIEWRADPVDLLGSRAGGAAAGAVTAVVFLQASGLDEPRLDPLPPGQMLQWVERHLHRPAPDPERARKVLARLCQTVPAFTLTAGPPDWTARLCDEALLA